MRPVEISDAEYIYTMRKDKSKTKYLSPITGNIGEQISWITQYKEKEKEKKEFYFIIQSKKNENLGLVRMYDFKLDSFSWGSWLIQENAPKSTAIESAMQIYEFGFYTLGFEKAHFDVRKENTKVVSFHTRFGAKIINEIGLDYYFNFDKTTYENTKKKYKRYL